MITPGRRKNQETTFPERLRYRLASLRAVSSNEPEAGGKEGAITQRMQRHRSLILKFLPDALEYEMIAESREHP